MSATREYHYVQGRLRDRFPDHRHMYFGLSGTTLLYEALQHERRSSVILPAFICPEISAMVVQSGKQVYHIDVDPLTLHPVLENLERSIAAQADSEAVVLIDHPFGYPFPHLRRLRREFPQLLIVEDCVRCPGVRIRDEVPGQNADWVLLSMYKTVPGSRDGGILLTRSPLPLAPGRKTRPGMRERAATVRPLRFIRNRLARRRPDFYPQPDDLVMPRWKPRYGFPNDLCMTRFAAALGRLDARPPGGNQVARDLMDGLSRIPGIACIQANGGCRPEGDFVSFTITNQVRDTIVTKLHRKGLFLWPTWNLVPAHYHGFAGTFPYGADGSKHLAGHIAHIPVNSFLSRAQCRNILASLAELMMEQPVLPVPSAARTSCVSPNH